MLISSSVVSYDKLTRIDDVDSPLSLVKAYTNFDGVSIGQQDVLVETYISSFSK